MTSLLDAISNLPLPHLTFLGLVVLASLAVHAWSIRGVQRGRDEIGAALARDGYVVRSIELRWLTRGPFPDMRPPGVRNSPECLYYIVADDPSGRQRTGWARWRTRWPGQAADRWKMHWNDDRGAGRRGLSTMQFATTVLLGAALVMTLLFNVLARVR